MREATWIILSIAGALAACFLLVEDGDPPHIALPRMVAAIYISLQWFRFCRDRADNPDWC